MPLSSGFEYVVLRYGKSYEIRLSNVLKLFGEYDECVHLFVGNVQIYVSIFYILYVYICIYKSIYACSHTTLLPHIS